MGIADLGGRIAARGLKQGCHCRFDYLADCIARKRIQYEKAGGHFVSCQELLGPGTKGRQVEDITLFQHYGRSHALTPLWIGQADNGTFRHRGMFTQRLLNFQG